MQLTTHKTYLLLFTLMFGSLAWHNIYDSVVFPEPGIPTKIITPNPSSIPAVPCCFNHLSTSGLLLSSWADSVLGKHKVVGLQVGTVLVVTLYSSTSRVVHNLCSKVNVKHWKSAFFLYVVVIVVFWMTVLWLMLFVYVPCLVCSHR